ncbi:hypothetical protein MMC18_008384 [Xylographa bjoerkii]|nr:hypothetical protein [Xylographa bjoerkii]
MSVFPQRSRDGISASRTSHAASVSYMTGPTAQDQSNGPFPDSDGAIPARRHVRSDDQMTDDMINETAPPEVTNYGGTLGSSAYHDLNPQSTDGTVSGAGEGICAKAVKGDSKLIYKGHLVNGANGDNHFSDVDSAPQMEVADISLNSASRQTPAPTTVTPATTSNGSKQALVIPPSQTDSSLGSELFPYPQNVRLTVTDPQYNQPAVSRPAHGHRRRLRFMAWLRRHRHHRHGPWAPFIRRNWNAVSDAIREVELLGFGPSRRPNVEEGFIIDQE